jgi:uncharacterized membrane protein YfcA
LKPLFHVLFGRGFPLLLLCYALGKEWKFGGIHLDSSGPRSISQKEDLLKKRMLVNAFVGFIVGLGGGLVGLGGAELRLPYLVGSLRLSVKTAIPINLTISLLTILAALQWRVGWSRLDVETKIHLVIQITDARRRDALYRRLKM